MENKIKEFRSKLNLTQYQLAQLLDIPYTQIQHYERGRRAPSLETAILLARALNTTVEELFFLDEDQGE